MIHFANVAGVHKSKMDIRVEGDVSEGLSSRIIKSLQFIQRQGGGNQMLIIKRFHLCRGAGYSVFWTVDHKKSERLLGVILVQLLSKIRLPKYAHTLQVELVGPASPLGEWIMEWKYECQTCKPYCGLLADLALVLCHFIWERGTKSNSNVRFSFLELPSRLWYIMWEVSWLA